MYTSYSLAMTAVAISSFLSVATAFDASSNTNMVVYWGQGANQQRLAYFCQDSTIDIIPIGFVNVFPDQVNGSYPGTNFGNQCGDETYKNPDGTASRLLSHCPLIGPDIKTCQAAGKKILLSLGGSYPTDQVIKNEISATKFATFLWNAFGPVNASYNGPRPFGDAVVDGFDFDIENQLAVNENPNDLNRGYGTMVNTLRNLYASNKAKQYYISAAPQCIIPDAHLAPAIKSSWFDFIFVQFYNTPQCSARAFFDHRYGAYGGPDTDISFDAWVSFLTTYSHNPDVKIYLGLPAAPPVAYDSYMYLKPNESKALIEHFQCKHAENFGGVMLYEATYSQNYSIAGEPYAKVLKQYEKNCDCNRRPVTSSTLPASISPTTRSSARSSGTTTSSVKTFISSSRTITSSSPAVTSGSKAATSSSKSVVSSSRAVTSSSRTLTSTSRTLVARTTAIGYNSVTLKPYSSYPYSSGSAPVYQASGTVPRPYSSSPPFPYFSGSASVYQASGTVSRPYSSSPPFPYSSGSASVYQAAGTVSRPYSSSPPFPYSSGSASVYQASGTSPRPYSSNPPYPYSSGSVLHHQASGISSRTYSSSAPYSCSGTAANLHSSGPAPSLQPSGTGPRIYSSVAPPYAYSSGVDVYPSSVGTAPYPYSTKVSSVSHSSLTELYPYPSGVISAPSYSPPEPNAYSSAIVSSRQASGTEVQVSSTPYTSATGIDRVVSSGSLPLPSSGILYPYHNASSASNSESPTEGSTCLSISPSAAPTPNFGSSVSSSTVIIPGQSISVSTRIYESITTSAPAHETSSVHEHGTTSLPSIIYSAGHGPSPITQLAVTTVITTSYVTVCPITKTLTSGGTKAIQTTLSTSTVYITYTSTICTKCVAPPTPAPVKPSATSLPATTQDVVTTVIVHTIYTTCPVTHTITSGTKEVVQVSQTVSTVYETITSTICTKCVAPPTPAPTASSLAATTQDVVTTVFVYTTYTTCPVMQTVTSGTKEVVQVTRTVSTIYETLTSTICTKCIPPPTPAPTPANTPSTISATTQEVVTTIIVYTTFTTCPVTSTITVGTSTGIQVLQSVSTIYETVTSTICTKCVAPPTVIPGSGAPHQASLAVSTAPVAHSVDVGYSPSAGRPYSTIEIGSPAAPQSAETIVETHIPTTVVGIVTMTIVPVPLFTPEAATPVASIHGSSHVAPIYSPAPIAPETTAGPFPVASNGTAPGGTAGSLTGTAAIVTGTTQLFTGAANKISFGLTGSVVLAGAVLALLN